MQLTLSPLFSGSMVIQHGRPFLMWGRASPGAQVTVTRDKPQSTRSFTEEKKRFRIKTPCLSPCPPWLRNKKSVTYQTHVDENGSWRVTFEPVPAGGPYTLIIESGEEHITIENILSGDVWLCGGQSNMEMLMDRLKDNFPEEWNAEVFPPIRQFKVPQEWDFSGPHGDLSGGCWISASKETLNQFSATAWFFAKNLYARHKTPIGLVTAAWGGTPIESWMSREALEPFPEKIALGDQYAGPAVCAEIAAATNAAIQEWEKSLNREDAGLAQEWHTPQTGISGWDAITLPGDFADTLFSKDLSQRHIEPSVRDTEDTKENKNSIFPSVPFVSSCLSENSLTNKFCGVVWLARDFNVPAALAAQTAQLWLGTITDADTVYINGVEAGNTAYRYPPRKYPVPAGLLKEGKNRIVIRVICNDGEGGVTADKPIRIFNDDETVELAGTWRYKTGAAAPPRPAEFFFQRHPMGNFNAMISPLLALPFKGVIWYQGESNDSYPHDYAALFKAMIQDWRTKNGQEFPFLFVQLPIWGEPEDTNESDSWAIIREAQCAALSLPATGMAAALELGEWNDLHPMNKKDVGYRLFLAAQQTVFNQKNTAPGPRLHGIERRSGKLFLTFDNCGAGLCAAETPYCSIADGENLIRLPVVIEKTDTVSVDVSSLVKPEKVLYAWARNPRDRQLFNSEGLPVIPFKAYVK